MNEMNDQDAVRGAVRDVYGAVARNAGQADPSAGQSGGCAPGCCAGPNPATSLALGYRPEDLSAVPEGANLGLGCGNPQAIASLKAGERVLDLGSGGGFDCFLAAAQVGPTGTVIGVDMTPDMISLARRNAIDHPQVSFRLGEIEHLPVSDGSVDVVMSNCVVNLSPDKQQVMREAFRVLAPGGRLAIGDVVAIGPMPEALQDTLAALAGCVAGAATVDALRAMLTEAGFTDVAVEVDPASREVIASWLPGSGAEDAVAAAKITATKPGGATACCGADCCEDDA